MKVLVTGANGFIGKQLIAGLIEDGVEVVALVRDKASAQIISNARITVVDCALADYAKLDDTDKIFQNVDGIYHLAWEATSGKGRANPDLQLNNVKGTCDLVTFAKRIGCKRFVNAASVMEYEAISYLTQEGCKPGLGYIYSTAKLSGDFMAKVLASNYGISYSGMIISNIYGAGEHSERFICKLLDKMLQNEAIELTHGEQAYDFIYISDAIEAMKLVGKNGKDGSDYYIGHASWQPLKQYVLQMKEVLGSRSDLKFGSIAYHGPMNVYTNLDTQKLQRELGFVPKISFAQGIRLLANEQKGRKEYDETICDTISRN